MRKLLSILLFVNIFIWGNMAFSDNTFFDSGSEYDYSDTLVIDSIAAPYDYDESLDSAVYVAGDSAEDLTPSPYAGIEFDAIDDLGATFKFKVNDLGPTVTLLNGNANGAAHLVIPPLVEYDGTLFTVNAIGDFAFRSYGSISMPMTGVTQLTIPEGIISVGQNAFEKSPDLVSVDIPSTLGNISYMIFANCPKLTTVNIPVNSAISTIGSFAFERCVSLDSFFIPESVLSIEQGPWRGCTSLEKLTLAEENYNFVEVNGVLYSGWMGNLLQYPAGKKDIAYNILFGIESIANSAFYGNPYIEKVVLPASLTSISHIAFYDCKSLNDVVTNSMLDFIGNKAFGECPSLKQITLYGHPAYTHTPGDSYNTFSNSTKVKFVPEGLPKVKLPKSDLGILHSAFEYISKMPDFETIEFNANGEYDLFNGNFDHGTVTVYGNSGPKKDVLRVLEAVPAEYLVIEYVDDDERIDRIYVDSSNKNKQRFLYFHGGISGNDLVVAYVDNATAGQIENLLMGLKE